MSAKKPRILIIGAGVAGLTAAHKLHTSSNGSIELHVAEAGSRIGGRINTSVFCGDRIELGATWIHGIEGSPVYGLARELGSLESTRSWEFMDSSFDGPITISESGYEFNEMLVKSVSDFFDALMDFAQGKNIKEKESNYCKVALNSDEGCVENKYLTAIERNKLNYCKLAEMAYETCLKNGDFEKISIGAFLRQGFELYWSVIGEKEDKKSCFESVFEMKKNTLRAYMSTDDLETLDFKAEREYKKFPGEEITIAKGYMSIIDYLASVLPHGCVKLGKIVTKIEWLSEDREDLNSKFEGETRVVKVKFSDGSYMYADHVIVTVSLGVLKASVSENCYEKSGLFDPPLPSFKVEAISRLGYGLVNKLFLELSPSGLGEGSAKQNFPFLQMVFHKDTDLYTDKHIQTNTDNLGGRMQESLSESRDPKIPRWMRRTSSLYPIYGNSNVVLCWFVGKEALELESLKDEEIVKGVSSTLSCLLKKSKLKLSSFGKVSKSQWGNDPFFRGSYSYVAVGSKGEDFDTLAMPLPEIGKNEKSCFPLQVLFAGEATHRTYYSTTHGAYFSGLREANRLIQHYGL